MLDEPTDYRPPSSNNSRLPLLLLIMAALGGLLLVLVFSSLLFCWPFNIGASCRDDGGRATPIATQVADGQPNPVGGGAVPTPFQTRIAVAMPGQSLQIQVGNGAPVTLTVDAPATLQVGEETFTVRPQQMDESGFWTPAIAAEADAAWLNGTIVNYVLALADTEANRTLVESLERNDEIVMATTTGINRRFSVSSREILPTTNTDVFAQAAPGITIVLVGLGDQFTDRYVIKARYVAEESLPVVSVDGGAGGNVIPLLLSPGETANLGDLAVRVNGFSNRPEPSGAFTYELVDYEVANRGGVLFDAALLEMTLRDLAGNPYVVNDEASIQGNFPPLIPQISVGDLLPATVGYKVPAGLDRTNLKWIVKRTDTGESAEFAVNTPAAETAEPNAAIIQLTNAALSPDATTMTLNGQISNPTAQPIEIGRDVVSLVGGEAIYLILSSTEFPWVIPPGQAVQYTVTFQRPFGTANATFSIANQSFQLNGWQ